MTLSAFGSSTPLKVEAIATPHCCRTTCFAAVWVERRRASLAAHALLLSRSAMQPLPPLVRSGGRRPARPSPRLARVYSFGENSHAKDLVSTCTGNGGVCYHRPGSGRRTLQSSQVGEGRRRRWVGLHLCRSCRTAFVYPAALRNSAMPTQTKLITNVLSGEKPRGGKSTPPR